MNWENSRTATPLKRDFIANKWSALIGRMDVKDLLDLYFLERAGYDVLAHFEDGQKKDGGLEPGMLSQLISEIQLDFPTDYLTESLPHEDFQSFVDRVRKELALRALPPTNQ